MAQAWWSDADQERLDAIEDTYGKGVKRYGELQAKAERTDEEEQELKGIDKGLRDLKDWHERIMAKNPFTQIIKERTSK